MNTISLALKGASNVLFAGLVFGVGLPVIYAGHEGADHRRQRRHRPRRHAPAAPDRLSKAIAALLLAVIVGGVALGITIIVASGLGKVVTFDHIIPMLVDKKK